MKRFIAMSAIIVMLMAGCSTVENEAGKNAASMFIRVETTSSWTVVYHRDTKVMYAVSEGSGNYGTFTLLVNADGTPMVW